MYVCACAQPANFLHFYTLLGPSQGMALPKVGESSHFIYEVESRYLLIGNGQGPISQVVLDFLKLAINNNHQTMKISTYFLFVCFWVRVSLCIPGCSVQIRLVLNSEIHLPLLPGLKANAPHPAIRTLTLARSQRYTIFMYFFLVSFCISSSSASTKNLFFFL